MARKITKAKLSKAGEDLQNPRTREARESEAARQLAKARWSKKK